MMEICFGDSVKGALSCAQPCGHSCGGAAAIGVIGQGKLHWWQRRKILKQAQKERMELEKQAIPLGGKRDDLVGISFDFSMGDIAAPLTNGACPRKQFIFRQLTADPWGEFDEAEASAEQFWQACQADLEKLKTRAALGEAVRIWVDATPAAACGLLFVADLLSDLDGTITLVPLPKEYKRADGTRVEYRGWGEVPPELFGSFLSDAYALSKEQLAALAKQWKKLQQENAPLRVVQNETVVSAEMDYYDAIIREEYPPDSCRVGELIGNVLARHHRLGVGDWLIAQRIRVLLAAGELELRKADSTRFYASVIARAK